jgi:imidazolonepropionase-like amidohydrolase
MQQRNAVLPILALCATLLAAPLCQAQANAGSGSCGQAAFTIVGARVFDGERWLPPGTQVRVQHGLVLAVGPDVGLARGGTIIDGTGKTLLPEQVQAQPVRAADGSAAMAENDDSGYGAIVTGARADLRLVEGDGNQAWAGLGAISARWKNGVLIGWRSAAKDL